MRRNIIYAPISRRSVVKLLGSALLGNAATSSRASDRSRVILPRDSWAVFYGDQIDLRQLIKFDIVVLDPGFQGDVQTLNKHVNQTFGYISLGEVEKISPVYPLLKDPSVVLDENFNWPGTFRVDVRKPAWKNLIIDEVVPMVLAKGFRGLFFDTLDAPPYLEDIEPKKFKGMKNAAIDLVNSIRRHFPNTPMIMNRGYEILADVHHDIDAVLAESLLTGFDGSGGYYLLDQPEIDQQLDFLRVAKNRPSPLPVLSLDYWNPADPAGVAKLYDRERRLGHMPYVSTRDLHAVFPEPHT